MNKCHILKISPYEFYSMTWRKKLDAVLVYQKGEYFGWTVRDETGILGLEPYYTYEELEKFITSVDDWVRI